MTDYNRKLVKYVMKFLRLKQPAAEAWLDENAPLWRSGPKQ